MGAYEIIRHVAKVPDSTLMLIRKFIFGKVTRLFSQRFLKRFSHKNTYTKDLRVPGVRTFFIGSSWGRAPAPPNRHRAQCAIFRRPPLKIKNSNFWACQGLSGQRSAPIWCSNTRKNSYNICSEITEILIKIVHEINKTARPPILWEFFLRFEHQIGTLL